eukprot:7124139-Prymnesium_polylepis.1
MSVDERIAAAQRLKEAGNSLLNDGDYEEALQAYNEGLQHVGLDLEGSPSQQELVRVVRLPLLLNSVLCDLKMNPEDQTRRLTIAEERIAEVLSLEPANRKALFRRAQLLGRAGEYAEAKDMLENLVRQQPGERAFRTELASVNERIHEAKAQTAAFWSVALQKALASDMDSMEGGARTDCSSTNTASGSGHALRLWAA